MPAPSSTSASTSCWPSSTRRRPIPSSSAAASTTSGWPGSTSPRAGAAWACRPPLQRQVDERLYAAGAAPPGQPRTSSASTMAGAHRGHPRRRGAAGAAAAPHVHRRGRLVPAVQRAGRRLRPGRPGHQGGARRRRVGDHRPEGVEHAGPHRRPGHARGPHRSRCAQAQGPHLLRPRHARARRRGPAAAPDHRRGRVQRGLHDRGPRARRRPHRRRRRGLAGGHDHAHERAHHHRRRGRPAPPWLRRHRRGGAHLAGRGRRPDARRTRDRLMQLWIEAEVLRLTNIRARRTARPATPGPRARSPSSSSPRSTRRSTSCASTCSAPAALVDYDYTMRRAESLGLVGPPGSARKMFLRSRANSIEGGTSEIQRNILGERVLGLPGEPRVDKELPWSQVPRS